MVIYNQLQLNLANNLFNIISLKKQYLKKIELTVQLLSKIKSINYKKICLKSFQMFIKYKNSVFVTYVIEISFLRKNTLIHVNNYLGNLIFCSSSGNVKLTGKSKSHRLIILRKFYRIVVSKLKFLKNQPLAIHFKNIDFDLSWLIKKLKKKFLLILTKYFKNYPYNGCRKKKLRRKKFKSRLFSF
jgi:hypothetical protein